MFVLSFQVVSVHADNSYSLSYMDKCKSKDKEQYTWPGEEVYFVHPQSDILTKLDNPEPVARGSRVVFKFDMAEAFELFYSE